MITNHNTYIVVTTNYTMEPTTLSKFSKKLLYKHKWVYLGLTEGSKQ